MEKADSCRRAAREAVADVEPAQLHDLIEATLDEASMVPGVLTIESAVATSGNGTLEFECRSDGTGTVPADADHSRVDRDQDGEYETDAGGLATQAAGVQLIYEGLRLTRSLAHDEPWTDLDRTDGNPAPEAADGAETASADGAGDLEILAADILVARGFYLLARTEAAGKAVRTVQAFGRDQTRRDALADGDDPTSAGAADTADGTAPGASANGDAGVDPAAIDANLERDILELAVLTGAAAVGDTPSPRLLAAADAIADRLDAPFPPAPECLADLEPSLSEQSLEDHTTDRATSATDP